MTIGQVAARAGVATSAVRYYERRNHLAADARQRPTPLHAGDARGLVIIGMLQDAGLERDEIADILGASRGTGGPGPPSEPVPWLARMLR